VNKRMLVKVAVLPIAVALTASGVIVGEAQASTNQTLIQAITKSQRVEGAWYVDTLGAPFTPHLFAFHNDGILHVTFPDAAEKNNSAGMGIGAWDKTGKRYAGKFIENNADKRTNLFTSNLIVTFVITVDGNTFSGPAQASYFGANGQLLEGPFPATLKGQRITLDSAAPVVVTQ
jgi:hypothetical protein